MNLQSKLSFAHKLGVLIPVWNDVQNIANCVESLLSQNYGDFHIFISDNCSTDGTKELLIERYSKNSQITLFFQEKNMGALWNFRFLTSLIAADYFMFIGSDDVISSNFFHDAVTMLEQNPHIGMVLPQVEYLWRGIKFYGQDESIDKKGSGARLLQYLVRVKDNGRFYHVGRSDKAQEQFETCAEICSEVGFDHCFMAIRHVYLKSAQLDQCRIIRKLGKGSKMTTDENKGLLYCFMVMRNSFEYMCNIFSVIRYLRGCKSIGFTDAIIAFVLVIIYHVLKRNLGVAGSIFVKEPLRKLKRALN